MSKFARIREERERKRFQEWAAARNKPSKPGIWLQNLPLEEWEVWNENIERRRSELPERFKHRSEAVQDMYIIHYVEIPEEMGA